MTWRAGPLAALALTASLLGSSTLLAADDKKAPVKDESAFGALKSVSVEEARTQAEKWLKETAKKTDAASLASFKATWDTADRPLIDKVSDTLALGNPDAAKLLKEARDPE